MKIKDAGNLEFDEKCPLGNKSNHSLFLMAFLGSLGVIISLGFVWSCCTWYNLNSFDPTSIFDLLVVIFYVASILLITSWILILIMVRRRQCNKDEQKEKKK
jgi:TRAP-type C4-dicarboxylate transport system permease small subunit